MPIDKTAEHHATSPSSTDELLIMGLMAGTSVDGIDAALIYSNGTSIRRTGHGLTTSYEPTTRDAIFQAFDTPHAVDSGLALLIARDHARAAEMLIAESGLMPDIISFHGQTIYHAPDDGVSIQLGDAGYLAQRLGVQVAYQFRQRDIAHGGQGAPLAPIYHQGLMQAMGLELPAAMVNIGGISNASIWDGTRLIGLDLGPGNALMDDLAQQYLGKPYDEHGVLAQRGKPDMALVHDALNHKFFTVKGPKSLDRRGLHDIIPMDRLAALSPPDHMASLVMITAMCITRGISLNTPDTSNVVICGGGSFNPTLMTAIQQLSGNMRITQMEDHMLAGMPLDSRFIEAELMAYLAARSYHDMPITFPETTGVSAPQCGGVWVRATPK